MSKDDEEAEVKITLRVPVALHARVKEAARLQRRSLNAQVLSLVEEGVERWERERQASGN